jgi:hypothetical protein
VTPELAALTLADPPKRWADLGFSARGSEVSLGGVRLRLGAPGAGIVGWVVAGIESISDIDGLPTEVTTRDPPASVAHENGALAIDHVVVTTTAFDRTAAALDQAGMPLKRTITTPKESRMAFRRLGPAILELVEVTEGPPSPARFLGLVVVVDDLDALATRLGDRLGQVRDAVQPGRRIATLRESAGLGQAVAFMTPELRSPSK